MTAIQTSFPSGDFVMWQSKTRMLLPNKFNFSSPQLKFRILIFKLIKSANCPFNGSNFKLNPYMECQSIVQQKGEMVYGGLQL
jgi:hypothetical protein